MNHNDGGKGSKQRPTDNQKYATNYDAIFGKNKQPLATEPAEADGDKKPHKTSDI